MSREQLLALTADVDRLLAAGAGVAVGDERLRQRAKTVRELSAQVPTLVPVADAIDRVLTSAPTKAAPALLDLLLLTQQLRFSLAPSDVPGPLEELEPSGPWATPASTRDVTQLREALSAGYGRVELLKEAIERKTVADLRMLTPLLGALDGHYVMNSLVAEQALPAFGKSVLPELRRGFNVKGDRKDALRLLAICKVDGATGLEFARAALVQGRIALREQALRCLLDLAPIEAENTALELLAKEVQAQVRCVALQALKSSTRDEALAVLMDGICSKSQAIANAAREPLSVLPHPKTTSRVAEALQAAVRALDEAPAQKAGKATKGKRAAAAPESTATAVLSRVENLLRVLGARGDAQAVPAILPLLKHPQVNIRERAAEALASLGDTRGLEAAVGLMADPKAWRAGVRAAWRLPPKKRYETLAPLCSELSKPKRTQRERGMFLLFLFEQEVTGTSADFDEDDDFVEQQPQPKAPRTDWDSRWVKTLTAHLNGPCRPEVAIALEVVQRDKAAPALARILVASVKKNECGVVEALGRLGVRQVVPTLVTLMPGQPSHHYCIHDALRRIGDKSAIPLLEQLLDKTRDTYRKSQIQAVIDHLQAHGKA